jgi:UDP:flavonoid glycosyltransferase YjiC (YdhE family)
VHVRVLFTTWGWPSHLRAMVPLAVALRDQGHKVLLAAPPALAASAAFSPAVAVGKDIDTLPAFRSFVIQPAPMTVPSAPLTPAPGSTAPPRALSVFVESAEAMCDDLIGVIRRQQPDLLVYSPLTLAAPVAAAVTSVPAVRHLFGPDVARQLDQFLPAALAPLEDRYRAASAAPAATIDPCPPSLQLWQAADGAPVIGLQYTPFTEGWQRKYQPSCDRRPSAAGRPRVCVTWGMTMARLDLGLHLAGAVARSLGDLGVQPVVAVTTDQRRLLGELPPGTEVVLDAPLYQVLPSCAVVVSHGGAGTVLTSLRAGIPQVAVAQLPDHLFHARRLAAVGAGLMLRPGPLEAVRLAVAEVLAGPGYRQVARSLQAEVEVALPPAGAAAKLATLFGDSGRET